MQQYTASKEPTLAGLIRRHRSKTIACNTSATLTDILDGSTRGPARLSDLQKFRQIRNKWCGIVVHTRPTLMESTDLAKADNKTIHSRPKGCRI